MAKGDADAYLGALSKAMGPSAEPAPDMGGGGEDVYLDDALDCLDKAIAAAGDPDIRSKLEQARRLIEECAEDPEGAEGGEEPSGEAAAPPEM